jgi:hypothetical protein
MNDKRRRGFQGVGTWKNWFPVFLSPCKMLSSPPGVELLTLVYNFHRMTWGDEKKWKSINQHQPSKQTMKIPFVLKHTKFPSFFLCLTIFPLSPTLSSWTNWKYNKTSLSYSHSVFLLTNFSSRMKLTKEFFERYFNFAVCQFSHFPRKLLDALHRQHNSMKWGSNLLHPPWYPYLFVLFQVFFRLSILR